MGNFFLAPLFIPPRMLPAAPAVLLLLFLLATCSQAGRVTNPARVPKNAVLLSKVSSLTVRAGKQTAARRVPPVPQLRCVGPSAVCKLYEVDVMRCKNEGADYDPDNIQWSCRAALPEEFKLGSTDVSCEGYESSDDPYVLKGSCGVEYRLLLTEKGEARYGRKPSYVGTDDNTAEKYAGYVFVVLFLIVLFIILRGIYQAWRNDRPRNGGRRLGGRGPHNGGGADDDDDNDPPPPYDPFPRTYPRSKKSSNQASASSSNAGPSSARSAGANQPEDWRPGFWTGTLAGAAAGYFAGTRNQARARPDMTERRPNLGLFGRGAGSNWARQSPPSSRSPSSGQPYSSTRYESTGFGSTSRR